MATAKNTIKDWFRTNFKPTQSQFWAWIDSFWHKDEKIPITNIENIEAILAEKADVDAVTALMNKTALVWSDTDNGNAAVLSNKGPYNQGGLDSVDLSTCDYTTDPATTEKVGAMGDNSFAQGLNVKAKNFFTVVFGFLIDGSGIGSFLSGFNLRDNGYLNTVFGVGHDVTNVGCTVVGQASNIIDEQIVDFNASPRKPLFVVGNGDIYNGDELYGVQSRSDALMVRKDGSIEAPSTTNELIDADVSGKILVTKEYLSTLNSRPYKVYTALLSQMSATPINSGNLIEGHLYKVIVEGSSAALFPVANGYNGMLIGVPSFVAATGIVIDWGGATVQDMTTSGITAKVLENTIGEIVWTVESSSIMANLQGAVFDVEKTICFFQPYRNMYDDIMNVLETIEVYGNGIEIFIRNINTQVSGLEHSNVPVEIRVYPSDQGGIIL